MDINLDDIEIDDIIGYRHNLINLKYGIIHSIFSPNEFTIVNSRGDYVYYVHSDDILEHHKPSLSLSVTPNLGDIVTLNAHEENKRLNIIFDEMCVKSMLGDYIILSQRLDNAFLEVTVPKTEFHDRVFKLTNDNTTLQLSQPQAHTQCNHSNKYVNSAGGIAFWYCPKCKQDLGDV